MSDWAQDRQDSEDVKRLAYSYLQLTRCVGGRLRVSGYVCTHDGCTSDNPSNYCQAPKACLKPLLVKDGRVWISQAAAAGKVQDALAK